jgi:biotin synthase-like enzyme
MKRVLYIWLLLSVCTFATAQKAQSPPEQLDAAQLDKLAAVPSLDQAILRIAAEKLRQEKKPMETVELQLTVKLTSFKGCIQECVYSGPKKIACTKIFCNLPD